MRRWNGWGDESTLYPLPPSAAQYLERLVGKMNPPPDASLEEVLQAVPTSQIPHNSLITTDRGERLRHACGQSLPDWAALRSGHIPAFPEGVAFPASNDEIRCLLEYAVQNSVRMIPYGGGTSVVGHINPLPDGIRTLTIDLSRMDKLVDLDETSRLATFEAGVRGPSLETQLNAKGLTLGHFPQSFELSSLGGWISTRSSGQQSYHYGRIEDLFAGGHIETLAGPLDLPCLPASAAGPDLRQMILGSEGRLGILTQAAVRVQPLPERDDFYGVFFHDWQSGAEAVRAIAQSGIPVSMLRLSDAQETETTLILSGKDNLVKWALGGLEILRYGSQRSLLVYGITGDHRIAAWADRRVRAICRSHSGFLAGAVVGKIWRKSRFHTPYLRNTLWEAGYALDTMETAVPWSQVFATAAAVKEALQNALSHGGVAEPDARPLVFAHLSHIYPDGASIYITYLFLRSRDPDETLQRWRLLKRAGSQAIIDHGGTISHQHGVGIDHAPYLTREKGPVGMEMLKAICKQLDPNGLLNPGKLIEGE